MRKARLHAEGACCGDRARVGRIGRLPEGDSGEQASPACAWFKEEEARKQQSHRRGSARCRAAGRRVVLHSPSITFQVRRKPGGSLHELCQHRGRKRKPRSRAESAPQERDVGTG